MNPEDQQPGADTPETEVVPAAVEAPAAPVVTGGTGGELLPPAATGEEGDEEDGMLRMSFLEHLEELRKRLIGALAGLGVSFALCLVFANQIWVFVSAPAITALKNIGAQPNLVFTKPTEAFSMIWVKAPMLASLFLAAPWILYQIWAFIAPGLYRKERRWAAPFVICTAGLFIMGGAFAYFVAFRFGLEFLLSIGRDIHVTPMITATEYFDLFVNATLGIGLVFELPVLLFFLTLLRIVSPRFLLKNTRYAVLAITIIAAIVTPTPDIFNLMLFAVPMCGLFFVGVFASYLLVLHREKRSFPWAKVLYALLVALVVIAGILYLAVSKYGYHLALRWPFLIR
jgi:sec-independent protein translocase protein TatC